MAISNIGKNDLDQLTLKVDPNEVLIDEKGIEYRALDKGKITIENLAANSTSIFKGNKKRRHISRSEPNEGIARWERMKIEVYNYFGLAKHTLVR